MREWATHMVRIFVEVDAIFERFSQKETIIKLSEHNENLVWDRSGSLRWPCAKFGLFEALHADLFDL